MFHIRRLKQGLKYFPFHDGRTVVFLHDICMRTFSLQTLMPQIRKAFLIVQCLDDYSSTDEDVLHCSNHEHVINDCTAMISDFTDQNWR